MKLYHFSDNHGNIDWLSTVDFSEIDLIVSTGDFFPNCSRVNAEKEVTFQRAWFQRNKDFLFEKFAGKTILIVNGNHDFICLAEELYSAGYYDAIKITTEGETIDGITFAGFGEIPYITGQWNREVDWRELKDLVEETLWCVPDVLITHAPPASILDAGLGIEPLLTALTYDRHKVKHHLFGHCHEFGGQRCERMEIKFYNSATTAQVIEI